MGFIWITNNIIPFLLIVCCVVLLIAYFCIIAIKHNKSQKIERQKINSIAGQRKFVSTKESGEVTGMKEAKNAEQEQSIDDIINKL